MSKPNLVAGYACTPDAGLTAPGRKSPTQRSAQATYKRILCPYDGSPAAKQGLEEAIRLADDQQAQLRILTVIEDNSVLQESALEAGKLFTSEFHDMWNVNGKQLISQALAVAQRSAVAADAVAIRSLSSRCAESIVEEARAWNADLIVMGTHGRRGVSRLVLGSDAEFVARSSPVPVLLIRASERPPSSPA
jgi:nucleotide-binding universal stress UspA family protein